MYQQYSAAVDNVIGIHQVTADWTSTLVYNNTIASSPSGTISGTVLDYQAINGIDEYTWDITDLVIDWYDGSKVN